MDVVPPRFQRTLLGERFLIFELMEEAAEDEEESDPEVAGFILPHI